MSIVNVSKFNGYEMEDWYSYSKQRYMANNERYQHTRYYSMAAQLDGDSDYLDRFELGEAEDIIRENGKSLSKAEDVMRSKLNISFLKSKQDREHKLLLEMFKSEYNLGELCKGGKIAFNELGDGRIRAWLYVSYVDFFKWKEIKNDAEIIKRAGFEDKDDLKTFLIQLYGLELDEKPYIYYIEFDYVPFPKLPK